MDITKSLSNANRSTSFLRSWKILLAFLIAVVSISFSWHKLSLNVSSLQFLQSSASTEIDSDNAPNIDNHRMAVIWKAQRLIQMDHYDEAIHLLENTIPNSTQILKFKDFTLCKAYGISNHVEQAIAACSSVKSTFSLLALGWLSLNLNKTEDARQYFLRLYELDGSTSINGLVRSYIAENNLEAAEKVLKEATEKYPDERYQKEWRLLLGQTLVQDGKFDEAQDFYEQFIIDFPDHTEARLHLGEILYQTTGISAAREMIETAIQIDPESPEGPKAMAKVLGLEGLWYEADIYFLQAISLADENDHWLSINAATNMFNAGEYSEAIIRYNAILENDAERIPVEARNQVYFLLAKAYLTISDKPAAANTARQLLSLNLNDTLSATRAARIFEDAGERALAIEAFEKALALDPDNFTAAEGLKRLLSTDN